MPILVKKRVWGRELERILYMVTLGFLNSNGVTIGFFDDQNVIDSKDQMMFKVLHS